MTSHLPFKAVRRNNNPRYIERQLPGSLPPGLDTVDLRPFSFIACQSMSMPEPFDAMVLNVDPRNRRLRVIDRMGTLRMLRYDQVLSMTRASRSDEDGFFEIFPIETEQVRSCSPNTLLEQLRKSDYPRVLVYDGGSWVLIPLTPNGQKSFVPDEAANIATQAACMFETPVYVRGENYKRGYVSLLNSNVGEAVDWNARSLAQFLELRQKAVLELSYEYSEASLHLDLNEEFSVEVNWPIELEVAQAVAKFTNFVTTDVKEDDKAPRRVIVPTSHPILVNAVNFEPRRIARVADKKPAAPKKVAVRKKTAARKGIPRDVQREVGGTFAKPKAVVKKSVKKVAKKAGEP